MNRYTFTFTPKGGTNSEEVQGFGDTDAEALARAKRSCPALATAVHIEPNPVVSHHRPLERQHADFITATPQGPGDYPLRIVLTSATHACVEAPNGALFRGHTYRASMHLFCVDGVWGYCQNPTGFTTDIPFSTVPKGAYATIERDMLTRAREFLATEEGQGLRLEAEVGHTNNRLRSREEQRRTLQEQMDALDTAIARLRSREVAALFGEVLAQSYEEEAIL